MEKIGLIIILFAAGLGLVAAEILMLSFGVLALMSAACFVGAIYVGFTLSPTAGGVLVGLVAIGVPIFVGVMLKTLRRTRLGRKFMIRDAVAGAPAPEVLALIGREGVALSPLRPSGTIQIDEQRMPATAESGFIPVGATVRIIRAAELNVVVRLVTPAPAEEPK